MAKSKPTLLEAADKAADAAEATMDAADDAVLRAGATALAEKAVAGFTAQPHRPAIYRRMEGDPDSQFAGLWVECKSNTLGLERRVLLAQTYWKDIHETLVAGEFIRSWNIPGPYEVMVTRPAVLSETQTVTDEHGETTPLVLVPEREVPEIEWRVLPSPMEAGPEVFESIDELVKHWIRSQVLAAPYQKDPDSGN